MMEPGAMLCVYGATICKARLQRQRAMPWDTAAQSCKHHALAITAPHTHGTVVIHLTPGIHLFVTNP